MTVRITGLACRCIIGVRPWERRRRQRVVLDVAYEADLQAAAASDRLEDAIDYAALKARVASHVAASSFHLLEALASSVADLVLSDPRVRSCEVAVAKPGALSGARSVQVRLRRRRSS